MNSLTDYSQFKDSFYEQCNDPESRKLFDHLFDKFKVIPMRRGYVGYDCKNKLIEFNLVLDIKDTFLLLEITKPVETSDDNLCVETLSTKETVESLGLIDIDDLITAVEQIKDDVEKL